MAKVKLTVTESRCRGGYCHAGDVFMVEDLCPPICHELWNVMYPMVYVLQNGGTLDCGDVRAKMFDVRCPDEGRVVIHGEVVDDLPMEYVSRYSSPLGEILLVGDEVGLTGLWFEGQKNYAYNLGEHREIRELPLFQKTKKWLDIYFSGENPDFTLPLHLKGTPFQIKVWRALRTIPYGETVTYGDIARRLETCPGGTRTSPRAVGGAVGRNPISILVPCHRVMGGKGQLTGYAGGLERKTALLRLERAVIVAK